jgi:hypothetical protein
VFTRTGTTWNCSRKLSPLGDDEQASFGGSVALSDGTAVVGDPGTETGDRWYNDHAGFA